MNVANEEKQKNKFMSYSSSNKLVQVEEAKNYLNYD
jgi:hypothetical protein